LIFSEKYDENPEKALEQTARDQAIKFKKSIFKMKLK
jgi:hypothetical protein